MKTSLDVNIKNTDLENNKTYKLLEINEANGINRTVGYLV